MAIARFGDNSDVFVAYADDGRIECNACRLNSRATYRAIDKKSMVDHLEAHIDAGHKVPPEAFEDLTRRPKW
jgi:hypothetical protein